MAVTGFWPVYGNLKATLDYADNPDKTTPKEYLDKDLYSALRYAENDNKTDRQVFVGGINCSKQNVYTEMMTHYSHRKKRTARMVQSAATPIITQSGNRMLPVLTPKNVFFIIVSPCVSGKTLTIFCIAFGMTSIGSVVPEKTSMGK